MKFAFVEEHRNHIPVDRLCHILGVTSRGYRAWRSRPVSQRQRDDMVLLAHIREQHHLSLGSYGRPRMTQELKEVGLHVGHRRVGRLMRQNGIDVVRTRKYKVTTDSNHRFNIAPSWLDRNFTAERPNQKWAGDISYIWTREGWLYLAVMIDLHSRRVIGWAVSSRLKKDLALQALDRAVALRNPPPGCIHHTDRGSQYCSHDYQKRLCQLGFKASMSGKGCRSRNLLQDIEGRTHLAALLANTPTGNSSLIPIHQWLLQHPSTPLSNRRNSTRRLRTKNGLNENWMRN